MRFSKKAAAIFTVICLVFTLLLSSISLAADAAPAATNGDKLTVAKVTASNEAFPDTSPATKLLDGDITDNSYWTSDKSGVTVDFDLGKAFSITEVKMAFYNSSTQAVKFDLAVSDDGQAWTDVSKDLISKQGDATLQPFAVNKTGRYLRIIGHGNTTEKWYMFTSINEVEIYGKPAPVGTKLTVAKVTASNESDPANSPATKLLDGDITDNSFWTSDKSGVTVDFDLGKTYAITDANMAFYNAPYQSVKFDLAVSDDGQTWTEVSKDNASKLGDTGLQLFPVNKTGRYLRIIGHGNTTEKWYMFTSITEVEIYGKPAPQGTKLTVEKVTASHEADPAASPATKLIDGDITDNSFWTSDKSGVTVDFDLGKAYMITAANMAFYNAPYQAVKFDLAVSDDGKTWTEVSKGNASAQGDTGLQLFPVNKAGRYLRIIGHGNTTEKWYMFTSINEVEIYGKPAPEGTKLKVVKVTASHEADPAASPATKLLDGDITDNSFWTSDKSGVTVDFDLGKAYMITAANMAFYNAPYQAVKFDLAVSNDGKTWTEVSKGNASVQGDTGLQLFPVNKAGRYLRVIGHGNTTEKWYMFTSINEVEIYGNEASLPKTGGVPAGVFYGLGGLLAGAGFLLRKFKK